MKQPRFRAELSMSSQCVLLYDLAEADYHAGTIINPLCRLSDTEAQVLMDDLFRAGVRPSEGKGTAGQLSATQEHLLTVQQILQAVMPSALRLPEGTCLIDCTKLNV